MATIAWGKPKIYVKDLDDASAKWQVLPTPADGTTELSSEKGDKLEAKIEGGEYEDVKYGRSTYSLALTIRAAKGRKRPIASVDGVVSHSYAVVLQPEDPEVQGFAMLKAAVSVDDTFSAEEGGQWAYTFDALKSAEDKQQLYWGKVVVTETGGAISKIEIDPEDTDDDSDKFEVA